MNLKKSIFSYIVWAAFAFFCCLCAVLALEEAGIRQMLGWPLYGIVGAVCGYLLFTAAVFIAVRVIVMEINRHIRDPKKLEAVLSVVLPVAVLVGVVVYLVLYLVYHTPLTLENDNFYRQALVSDGKSVSFAVHGASWLYTCLLHVMLFIFGNTPFAGVVLQIILFFVCLLLLYIGVQAFAGTLPAAVSMAAFGFLPVSLRYVFSLTPELFSLTFYLLGFSLTGAFYKKFSRQGIHSWTEYIAVFLLGFYIGFLICLDIYGLSLYVFLAILFSLEKEKIRQAATVGIVCVLSGTGGFFLTIIVVCGLERISFFNCLQELFTLYFGKAGLDMELSRFISFLPDVTPGGSMALISIAFFIVPSFFLWRRGQCSAFIVNLFLVYGLSGASIFYLDAQMIATFAWSILAGMGVYGIVRSSGESDGIDRIDGIVQSEEEPIEEKSPEKTEDREKMKKKIIRKEKSEKEPDEKSKEKGTLKMDGMSVEISAAQKKEQEKPAPGEPLHNPLPVPKRRSRPQADFGYQVRENELKFDLDVAEDDDFDW